MAPNSALPLSAMNLDSIKKRAMAGGSCPTVDPETKVISGGSGICTDNGGSVVDVSLVPNKFGDPVNGRTPDIMVQPNASVIYSKSKAKDM